jgi:hypothetical protein
MHEDGILRDISGNVFNTKTWIHSGDSNIFEVSGLGNDAVFEKPDDGRNKLLRNIGTCMPNYTASCHRSLEWKSVLWMCSSSERITRNIYTEIGI